MSVYVHLTGGVAGVRSLQKDHYRFWSKERFEVQTEGDLGSAQRCPAGGEVGIPV